MGRPGWIEGRVDHLWHGDLARRGYGTRYAILQQFVFDPFTDLRKSAFGAWQWNSRKPDFHKAVEEFFRQRREDG
jgi:hypothetical protein